MATCRPLGPLRSQSTSYLVQTSAKARLIGRSALLAGVFVRPNIWNNGVEPAPFYSIPASLWSIGCMAHVCYCTASPTPEQKLPSTPFPAQTCPTKVGVYHNYNCGLWGFRAYHISGPMLGLLDHHICLVHQVEPLECLT